jgi:hypothetical protein
VFTPDTAVYDSALTPRAAIEQPPTKRNDDSWVDLDVDRDVDERRQQQIEPERLEIPLTVEEVQSQLSAGIARFEEKAQQRREAELVKVQAEAQARLTAEVERVQAEAEDRGKSRRRGRGPQRAARGARAGSPG